MRDKKISVIIPVYKVEAYISNCLHSLLEQTCQDFEIILIDDASPDQSIAIARSILETQSSIPYKIIHNDVNRGVATVRNIGLDHASGKYIVYVDSDDEVAHRYLEVLLYPLEADGDIDISIIQYEMYDTHIEGILNHFLGDPYPQQGKVTGDVALHNLLNDKERSYLVRCMFRRTVFENVLFPDGCNFMEDTITLPCLYANAKFVFYSQEVLYIYKFRSSSMTTGTINVNDYVQYPMMLDRTIHHLKKTKGLKMAQDISRFNFLCCYNIITVKLTRRNITFEQARSLYRIFANHLWKSELLSQLIYRKKRSLTWILTLRLQPKKIWKKDMDN